MFSKNNRVVISNNQLSNYIEGFDIYNSKLIYKLTDPDIDKVLYEITVYEFRPDLIAKDFYGSAEYLPYVLISSGLTLDQLKKGSIIKLIPKTTLDSLINTL